MKNIEEAVWKYYNTGFSIIPLGANGNLKAPSIEEWKKYQKIKPTKEEIKQWLKQDLFVGIGIIGGEVSQNLAVIDFDDEKLIEDAGLDLKAIIKRGNWVVKTGKGYHIYCRGTEPVKTRKAAIVSMDLKADKGYVAAPPSPHESGKQYKFLNKEFGDIPPMDVMGWFDEIVETVKQVRDIKPQPSKAKDAKDKDGDPECVGLMMQGAESGRRNETLFTLANYYKSIKELPLQTVKYILTTWNNGLDKPLSESEFNTTIESAFESKNSPGCSHIIDLGYCPYANDKNKCPFYKPVVVGMNPILLEYNVPKIGKNGVIIGYSYANLAELIKQEHNYNFLVVKDESTDKKSIFAYENGFYNKNGSDYIKKLVHTYLGSATTIKAKDEVIAAIVDTTPHRDRSSVEPDSRYINFNNGIYDIKTNKLLEHSPEFKFLQKLPINYNPQAKCPKIMKFFKEILKPEDIPVIQEMFGYCMYRSYRVSAAFILFGTGRNGKGVTLKLLRKLLGEKNVCSRKLHEITNDVFAKADLYGKLANVCGEMENTTLKETGNLKELTGEDWVTAQRKYHGAFQFQNYAKLIFSTNDVPNTTDYSFGFLDRMKIIEFTKIFNAGDPKTDSKLFEKISIGSEMEGLVNWSLCGLKRVLEHSAVSGAESLADMGQSYEDAVGYIFNWLEDNVSYDTGGNRLTIEELYAPFNEWCEKYNKPRVPLPLFGKKLFAYAKSNGFQKARFKIDGKVYRGYKYVKLEVAE